MNTKKGDEYYFKMHGVWLYNYFIFVDIRFGDFFLERILNVSFIVNFSIDEACL